MHVLPALAADDVHGALVGRQVMLAGGGFGVIAEVELPVRLAAPRCRRRLAVQEGTQALAVALSGNLDPDRLQQLRHHVDVLGEALDAGSAGGVGALSRVPDDQRDVVGAVEVATLADQPVVADLLAVV